MLYSCTVLALIGWKASCTRSGGCRLQMYCGLRRHFSPPGRNPPQNGNLDVRASGSNVAASFESLTSSSRLPSHRAATLRSCVLRTLPSDILSIGLLNQFRGERPKSPYTSL